MKKGAFILIAVIVALALILLILAGISRTNISYRIDDITFGKDQKQVLENALEIAEKYNISFDLGVIAKPFDENADSETFSIYENHKDRFDIIAHGLTHKNPLNNSNSPDCEFYDDINDIHVSYEIQEAHFVEMKEIFERRNMTKALEIFVAPRYAYDRNTMIIAKEYGYRMIKPSDVVSIPMKEKISDADITSARTWMRILSIFKDDIYVNMHPINLYDVDGVGRLVSSIKK